MKICFLAAADSVHSARWINYFAEKGHEVHWLSCVPARHTIHPSIRYKEIATIVPFPLNLLIYTIRTFRYLKNVKPDILHAHYAGTYGLVAFLTRFHPFYLTAWGSDVLLGGKSFLRRILLIRMLRAADLVTCDGINVKKRIAALSGRNDVALIRFGIETARFKPQRARGEEKTLTVISLRNHEAIYDLQTLLHAASLLMQKHLSIKFIIAGDGSEHNNLELLAEKLGLDSGGTVRFIGRFKNENLPELLDQADLYVSTSLSDGGLAVSTAEAMAMELPILITDVGDNKWWIETYGGGLLVPCQNPRILAEKIRYLFEHRALVPLMGKKNRKAVEEHYDCEKELQKMNVLYAK